MAEAADAGLQLPEVKPVMRARIDGEINRCAGAMRLPHQVAASLRRGPVVRGADQDQRRRINDGRAAAAPRIIGDGGSELPMEDVVKDPR